MTEKNANELIEEKSPYLLQHAYNPVNWLPWSEKAFEMAKQEDKPIFLSIGYSTCHWCHVMEKESFEDQEVAELLNQHYISIKVDREERPDIDQIYMNVCQMMTGRGGWPLTVIMSPDQKPFFAGTYFPKNSKYGQMGLMELLTTVTEKWGNNREKLIDSGTEIVAQLKKDVSSDSSMEEFDLEEIIHSAYRDLKRGFDAENGGFGRAPKFPTPHNLLFLLRYYRAFSKSGALNMVIDTLESMYRGGIYDHIGYGFSRYSTDSKWLVPHFEKMLYDNALLCMVYLECYQITDKKEFAEIADEILTYLTRGMLDEGGGFYSAEDADSEGVEGKFYLWTVSEVKEILGEDRGSEFCRVFDITKTGNFEGKNIPNLLKSEKKLLDLIHSYKEERNELFKERENRVHPARDDKILTSWNGLVLVSLSLAYKILEEDKYKEMGKKLIDFIWKNLRDNSGRLLLRYREGEAAHLSPVDGYAFFIWGLIEFYQATLDTDYLKKAVVLNDELLNHFWDKEKGGLYLYGDDAEKLIVRPKVVIDSAIPSGNSAAAYNLLRLARITGKQKYEDLTDNLINFVLPRIRHNPTQAAFFLISLLFKKAESREIIISTSKKEKTEEVLQLMNSKFMPFTVTLSIDGHEDIYELAPFTTNYQNGSNRMKVYICQDHACKEPLDSLNKFKDEINKW